MNQPRELTPSRLRRVVGFFFKTIALTVFIGGVGAFLYLMSERSFVSASFCLTFGLMAIPFLTELPWQEKITMSLVVPFIVLGIAGVMLDFTLIHVSSWVGDNFNDKVSGPLGMWMCVLLCSSLSGFLGYLLVHFVRKYSRSHPAH
jgi:hypothetical protein